MILNFVSDIIEKDEDIRISLEQDDHLVLKRVPQIELYAESLQHAYKEVRSKRWSVVNDATLDSREAGLRARKDAEESADSFVHERKESHKSSLSMCSVLTGAPPEIPKPISSLRLGTFSKFMYEELSSQRSRKGKYDAYVAAYASLVSSYAASHALSCASSSKMSVLMVDIHSQIQESERVKERAKELNTSADDEDDDDRVAMIAQLCSAVANQARTVANRAASNAMRNAYIAYRRMTVKIRERKLCVLWNTPSNRRDVEMIELSRGCPILEMAKTRDGWSWIAYEPKKEKRRRGKRKKYQEKEEVKTFDEEMLHLGVVPTEYCTLENKTSGEAAHAVYLLKSHQQRDISVETPALRRDRTMGVLKAALSMLKPCFDETDW